MKDSKAVSLAREKNPRAVLVDELGGVASRDGIAKKIIDPATLAAVGIESWTDAVGNGTDIEGLTRALKEQTGAVIGDDMARAQETLVCQAHLLDSVCLALLTKAKNAEYLRHFETYMRLALRAQNQSRMTLETLSAVKSPPMVGYVRQANIAQGPQQVNNGTAAAPSRAREIETEKTQLSARTHELLPDTRASGNESQANSALETLGEIDRAKVRRR